MQLPRRGILRAAGIAATLPMVPRRARAQAYPSRPITIVVSLAAGSGMDSITRLYA